MVASENSAGVSQARAEIAGFMVSEIGDLRRNRELSNAAKDMPRGSEEHVRYVEFLRERSQRLDLPGRDELGISGVAHRACVNDEGEIVLVLPHREAALVLKEIESGHSVARQPSSFVRRALGSPTFEQLRPELERISAGDRNRMEDWGFASPDEARDILALSRGELLVEPLSATARLARDNLDSVSIRFKDETLTGSSALKVLARRSTDAAFVSRLMPYVLAAVSDGPADRSKIVSAVLDYEPASNIRLAPAGLIAGLSKAHQPLKTLETFNEAVKESNGLRWSGIMVARGLKEEISQLEKSVAVGRASVFEM